MWDERYSGTDYFYGKEPNDFLKEHLEHIKNGDNVLCLAEGEGRNAVFVAVERRDAQVTAVDGSKVGLEKALSLAREKGVHVTTIHADLADFKFEEAHWDVIVSIWCHLPSDLRRRVHASAVRALKPNGRFILEAYTPAQLKYETGGPKSLDLLMQIEDLKRELSGLDFIVARECERTIQEGAGHSGLSAVVQVVGKKIIQK